MKRRQVLSGTSINYLHTPRVSMKRATRRVFRIAFLFSPFFAVAATVLFFVFGPVFQLKNVSISGNTVSSLDILETKIRQDTVRTIGPWETGNIFLFQDIEPRIIREFPEIKRVFAKRIFPNSLSVQIEERKPAALWCGMQSEKENSPCYFIDNDGTAFRVFQQEKEKRSIPLIESAQKTEEILGSIVINEQKLKQILMLYSRIPQENNISLQKILIQGQEDIAVISSYGFSMFFDFSQDINTQLKNLSLILSREIKKEDYGALEYIDLRIPNRVYYK